MSTRPLEMSDDPDLRLSLPAMRRAAHRAREIARQTNTFVIVGELGRVLRDLRAGRPRSEALRALADRLSTPAASSLVAALLVAEKQGSALGPVLRAQAEQRRNERFLRAEKLAMEAPVKMLPPLLIFVFPCTFLILLFPVASRFLEEGWLR